MLGIAVFSGDDAKTSSIEVAGFHCEADALVSGIELLGISLIESESRWQKLGAAEWKNAGKMGVGPGHAMSPLARSNL
ncbi:hypothetical protein [Methylosinus sp. LW4]|uniref:hypothetical protein n=1 Tax=Methylosinus sp. LW4 TaxID=136993 RepID=UPI0012FC2DD3|nr:hypothetical protein [Methylosinus sp. LW4]